MRDFIIEHPHIKFRYLSPYVNFSRTALDSTHPSFWDKHSDHVELLHFVGPAPWREGAEGYVDDIWKEIYQESLTQPTRSVASRILGTLKARLPI